MGLLTWREFIDNNLFVFLAIGALSFVLWVGQMLLEIEEKTAGIVIGLVAILCIGATLLVRAEHTASLIQARNAAQDAANRMREERVEKERIEAQRREEEERRAASIRAEEVMKRVQEDNARRAAQEQRYRESVEREAAAAKLADRCVRPQDVAMYVDGSCGCDGSVKYKITCASARIMRCETFCRNKGKSYDGEEIIEEGGVQKSTLSCGCR